MDLIILQVWGIEKHLSFSLKIISLIILRLIEILLRKSS